jgi:DNA polymerase III epsilon subunit
MRTHLRRWWVLIACLACASVGIGAENAAKDRPDAKDQVEKQKPPVPARTRISDLDFVAFDTETTGLNPRKDRVVEIAAVKFRDGKVVGKKSWLINPDRSIPYWVQRVHGITPAMVADKPSFKEVLPEFAAFVQDSVLVAHNARFDVSFMGEEIRRSNGAVPVNQVLDSLALFRNWFPEARSYSLTAMADRLGIEPQGAFHRAMADSMYLALAMNKGLERKESSARLSELITEAGGALTLAKK